MRGLKKMVVKIMVMEDVNHVKELMVVDIIMMKKSV